MRRLWVLLLAGLLTSCTGYVWGSNDQGQLGDGGTTSGNVAPTAEASASDWRVLRAGDAHACGVKFDLSLWCWGRNVSGQIGNGTFGSGEFEPSPVEIGTDNTWLNVFPGYNHTCAIDRTKQLWCWGLNSSGQLGQGDTVRQTTPTQVGTDADWNRVGLMSRSTCGIRNGDQMFCFGQNDQGQLGLGDTTARYFPEQVAGSWRIVDGGQSHACAITTSDELRCWGRAEEGQLGVDASIGPRTSPTAPSPEQDRDPSDVVWRSVSAGDNHTCALGTYTGDASWTSDLFCTGSNRDHKLGISDADLGEIDRFMRKVSYSGVWGSGWTQISSGGDHTCGVQNGTLKCVGRNDDGQLGDGTTTSRDRFGPAVISTDWVSVSAGQDFTVGLRNAD